MTHNNNWASYKRAVCGILIASTLLSCGGTQEPEPQNTGPQIPPFFIGNHATIHNIREDFSLYWNQLTPESAGFWGSIENTRGQYNWAQLDTIYQFAGQYNLPVKAHALISYEMAPPWLGNLILMQDLFREEMESGIRDYCARYPNTPMIDVIYNAMPRLGVSRVFENGLGPDWAVQSFKWAREYCPNSVLILEEHSLLTTDADRFIEWATPIIASGFVDAIGASARALEEVGPETIEANLNKLASLGLPIYISEWDIAEEDDEQQLTIMQQQLPIFYNHPSVAGITYWGYIEGQQFTSNVYLLRKDGTQRPAMAWMLNYIQENPRN